MEISLKLIAKRLAAVNKDPTRAAAITQISDELAGFVNSVVSGAEDPSSQPQRFNGDVQSGNSSLNLFKIFISEILKI